MEENSRVQPSEIRSTEVQEIVSQVPNALVRWGMVALFGVIGSLLGISWFIQYPDLLQATVVITTTPAPHNLVSRQSGHIVLLKEDNSNVHSGDLIAFLKSNAEPTIVLQLEKMLAENRRLRAQDPLHLLGDLQATYSLALKAELAMDNYYQNKSFDLQILQLQQQLGTYTKLTRSLVLQQKLTSQELMLANERFKTDSLLYTKEVLSSLDYNNAKSTWLQQQRTAQGIEAAIINNEVQINELRKQLADTEIRKAEEQQKLEQEILNTRESLQAQLTTWKENFLYIAPADGKVAYLGFLENNFFVTPAKQLFTVMPNQGKMIARAELPLQGSGKVKEGQEVNIRLENYPFEQFGMLRGKIAAISSVPNEGKYQLIIEIPQELLTTQKRKLEFRQQLTGTTEIITEDLRLLERFFYQFRKLVQVQ